MGMGLSLSSRDNQVLASLSRAALVAMLREDMRRTRKAWRDLRDQSFALHAANLQDSQAWRIQEEVQILRQRARAVRDYARLRRQARKLAQ